MLNRQFVQLFSVYFLCRKNYVIGNIIQTLWRHFFCIKNGPKGCFMTVLKFCGLGFYTIELDLAAKSDWTTLSCLEAKKNLFLSTYIRESILELMKIQLFRNQYHWSFLASGILLPKLFWPLWEEIVLGHFQLLDLIIIELKSHMIC